ncbi:sirohydrochlorin chelatase [Lentibacillus sp. N15]|uniref:sirohydrochlorin chelatase n=1 Tax=Lentibacillus songyuanensis TaxID=3136161 RepID=UPI0031B9F9A6
MQGVLYVSHGSRMLEATSEAMRCITDVKKQVDVPLQEICFLELAEPTVEQGMKKLVNQGASRIAVVPVLLLSAGHYYKDIPDKLSEARERYPSITFTYGQPLGVQDRFIQILMQRIAETGRAVGSDSKILLVGRGSHNPQTKSDVEMVRAKLGDQRPATPVDCCFLAACNPTFDQQLQVSLREGFSTLFIVPYLWFTGVLMHSIHKKVSEQMKQKTDIIVCQQLGDHPVMKAALKQRVYEAL